MKAVLIHQFGGPNVLTLEDIAQPKAATGEVLVRVHAAGVNPMDVQIRAGMGMAESLTGFPMILGWDLSGVIEAVGTGVARFKVGDHVYGSPRFPEPAGTYAEFALAPEHDLAFKPKNLTHLEAAAVPLAALTALQALETMRLHAGQTILVHAAAGGVGHFAVQLARVRGARVIGTASSRNEAFVRALGAEFLDYTAAPFERGLEPVDAVLDTIGGAVHVRSFKVVKPGGWLVSVVDTAPDWLRSQRPDVRSELILVKPSSAHLEYLAGLVENGQLKPVLSKVFPLQEVAEAHALSERRRVSGKIVLEARSRSP
jgi:NADPH:quinone reductase-like Zn-dependent oxidoreductase